MIHLCPITNSLCQLCQKSIPFPSDVNVQSSNNTSTCVPLEVTYYPNLPNFSAITRKFHPLLQISLELKCVFQEKPIIAYRRPNNLLDLLEKAQPQEFLPICDMGLGVSTYPNWHYSIGTSKTFNIQAIYC